MHRDIFFEKLKYINNVTDIEYKSISDIINTNISVNNLDNFSIKISNLYMYGNSGYIIIFNIIKLYYNRDTSIHIVIGNEHIEAGTWRDSNDFIFNVFLKDNIHYCTFKINDIKYTEIIPNYNSIVNYINLSVDYHKYGTILRFDELLIYHEYNEYLLFNNNSYYSLKMKDNSTNDYIAFKNIEDIPRDKYTTDLNNIVSTKNIDNLYPMNIIIKK